jgi:hypothetical protein
MTMPGMACGMKASWSSKRRKRNRERMTTVETMKEKIAVNIDAAGDSRAPGDDA